MPGTKDGAKLAKRTVTAKYGHDYYARIGRKGGIVSGTALLGAKGFAANKELARIAGQLGGRRKRS